MTLKKILSAILIGAFMISFPAANFDTPLTQTVSAKSIDKDYEKIKKNYERKRYAYERAKRKRKRQTQRQQQRCSILQSCLRSRTPRLLRSPQRI